MNKYFALSLLIGMALGGSNNTLIKDEAFYDNGNKKYQRYYKDGKADGKWTHWYESGNTWIEGHYSNGIRVEIWTTYYENGQEWTKGNYKVVKEMVNGSSLIKMVQSMKRKNISMVFCLS